MSFTSNVDLFLAGTLKGLCYIFDMNKFSIREKINLNV